MQRRRSRPCDPIRIGNTSVVPSSYITCLGVPIDCELSFKQHVTKTASACFSTLRNLKCIRRSVPQPLFASLVEALVLSRLSYCISVLYGCLLSLLCRLQAILHASARQVFLCGRFSHVTPLLQRLKWPSVVDRIQIRLASLAHACDRGFAPVYLSKELRLASDLPGRRSLRSATAKSLVLPLARHPTLGGRSFSVAAVRVWNRLPRHLTSVDCPKAFKKALRSHCMSAAFYFFNLSLSLLIFLFGNRP